MSADQSPAKKILLWSVIVAAALSVVATVVVGWYVWRSRKHAQTMTASEGGQPKPNTMANWSPATFSSAAPEAVRQTSDKSWSVKGGRAFMQVRRKSDESLEVRFVYPFDDFLSPESISLVQMRWRLSSVEKAADSLSITAEQLAALKAVSPATDMPVKTPEKERLRGLFEDYLAATDKSAAEKALIGGVTKLDAAYYDQTRDRAQAIADKVKAIFTPEQLTSLSEHLGLRMK
jgi:hypothetical protein